MRPPAPSERDVRVAPHPALAHPVTRLSTQGPSRLTGGSGTRSVSPLDTPGSAAGALEIGGIRSPCRTSSSVPRDGCPDESPARSPLSRLLQVHPLGHARVLRAPRMLPSRLSHSDASRARARQFAYTRATCEQAARPVPDSWAAHLEHPCPSQRSPVGESMTPSSSLPPNPICAICSKPIRSGFIYTKGSDAIHIRCRTQQLHLDALDQRDRARLAIESIGAMPSCQRPTWLRAWSDSPRCGLAP